LSRADQRSVDLIPILSDSDTRSEAGTERLKSIASTSLWLPELRSVFQLRFPGSARTMSAAEDLPVGFHSMADDPTMTVRTDWRERMDYTFEAIERVMLARYDDFKCFVVFVFANFAFSHPTNPFARRRRFGGIRFVL
jgi:hypothetical protein